MHSNPNRALFCALFVLAAAVTASPQKPKVLFLTHSAGFAHGVVKRGANAKLALAEKQLIAAARGQFEVVATQDCGTIGAAELKGYRAVVFYTTGELPISDANRNALFDFVRSGGGFAGIHSATDTYYKVPEYGELIGGYFHGHPWHQAVRVRVEDRRHPATMHLGEAFEITDEIYQFRDFDRSRVKVLLSLDGESVEIKKGRREDGDYALAWCRDHGKGRMFYTALGHRVDVWKDRRFLRHVVAGIRWAMNAESNIAKPPADAEILFGGKDTSKWVHRNGKDCTWSVRDGAMTVVSRTGNLHTRKKYGDFRMHVEFQVPDPTELGIKTSNSGVYIQDRYEVQILDTFGKKPLKHGCGSLYRKRAPDANASRENGAWQSYDIWFRAARFDDTGKKTQNVRIRVIHNGVVIHDGVELPSKTGAGKPEGPAPGPIVLQDHGAPVRFRNLWIAPLDEREFGGA